MSVVSLREHDLLYIGELDPKCPSVRIDQARQIEGLRGRHGFDVFERVGEAALSASQYVGAVQLGSLTVEVLPKVEGIDGTTMRRNLVAMLSTAYDLEVSIGEAASVALQRFGLLEFLVQFFVNRLFAELHRGLVRRYETREENLTVLRGRVLIGEQVRRNSIAPERFYCSYEEFTEDNPLNRILKAALRLLLAFSRNIDNQRSLAELLFAFEAVSDVDRHKLPWNEVGIDRLSVRYVPCLNLASLFLRQTPPDVTAGSAGGLSVFFDMNVLFEEFIGRVAARALRPLGYDVRLQEGRRYLVYDDVAERDAFLLKPDIVGRIDNKAAWIVDTKWKELSKHESRDGVAQADMYQMYAYARRYECPEVVLLYPHHAGLGPVSGVRRTYSVKADGNCGANRVRIATVDLTDLRSVPVQIKTLVPPSSGQLGTAGRAML
jgi:5-methylcytosine-specific restriction enzyme subunit McrC